MSRLPPNRVYQGFWIDQSRDNLFGSTITTTAETSNVVVAVVSIIITFAASHLWSIIAYTFFALYATNDPRDASHHQQQILLRNVAFPTTISFKLIRTNWRRAIDNSRQKVLNPMVLIASIALLCSIGFLVGGVVSSQIISTTNIDVLAKSDFCGFQVAAMDDQDAILSATYDKIATKSTIQYVHDCVNGSRSDPACNIYVTPFANFDTTYDDCPLNGLCTLEYNQALRMDTGLMWSNETFGMNLVPSSALALRKVAVCSPLNLSRYQEVAPMDRDHAALLWQRDPLPNENMTNYYLGKWYEAATYNSTLTASSIIQESWPTYSVGGAYWHHNESENFQDTWWYYLDTFEPIALISEAGGDFFLAGISANLMKYLTPVDDPVFAAHKTVQLEYFSQGYVNHTYYTADQALGFIGCVDQYQYCTPNNECTDLTHSMLAATQAVGLKLDALQNVTLYNMVDKLINYEIGMSWLLQQTEVFPLSVRDESGRLRSLQPVPPDQWEYEVKYWNAITLALLQRYIIEFAASKGIADERFDHIPRTPLTQYEKILCQSQKMKAPSGFSNISVFGLSFTIAFCGLIILVNICLVQALRWLSTALRKQWIFVEQWDRLEILQFQRSAYESNGIGNWSGDLNQIPTTPFGERFKEMSVLVTHQSVSRTPSDSVATVSGAEAGRTGSQTQGPGDQVARTTLTRASTN